MINSLCNLPFITCTLRKTFCSPFNSWKWLTCNFSLKYPYNIQQADSEKIQTYQVEVVISILHQILLSNFQGNVSQPEERINDKILGINVLQKKKQELDAKQFLKIQNF